MTEVFKPSDKALYKKWASFGLFLFLFDLVKQQYNFTTTKDLSSMQCWDQNPRPSDRESLTITTGQGSRPKFSQNFTLKTYLNSLKLFTKTGTIYTSVAKQVDSAIIAENSCCNL